MKKICMWSAVILLLTSMSVAAQETEPAQLNIIYKQLLKHEPNNPEGVVDVTFVMLSVGNTRAVIEDYAAYQTDSVKAIEGIDAARIKEYEIREGATECFFLPRLYLDLNSQTIEHHEPIIPNRFFYTEPFPTDWIMGEGTKEIAGYTCHEAKLSFAGREWTAWYTEELPLPYGPWKLAGLPGLILAAEDATGEISFELAEIRSKKGIVPPAVRLNSEFEIKRVDFLERYHTLYPLQKMNDINGIITMNVHKASNSKSVITINDGIVMRLYPNGFVFLEKE
ncbi:hypothetical protein IX336_001243 [Porphyromonas levii]|uniref:GLPGLI family protein n=1 Tax=Porphyromonas levii TaxID=28114 RepID=UPI001BAAA2A8|nr:GLPGLI family protein [Porphyromonas levii]MBR8765865.1 hypothetical protein [Porphyromonas levii]